MLPIVRHNSTILPSHIATYTLVATNTYGIFDLDIAADSYWEDYVPLSLLAKDVIVDANGTSVATTTFQMIPLSGTSKPTANAASRGHVYTTEGGTGVADVVEVCLKSSTETYSWVNLATG